MRTLAILALLLCIAAPVSASTTEADTIRAVYATWGEDGDNNKALAALDDLFTDTMSEACKNFIGLLFTGISLIEMGEQHSPVNHLGSKLGVALLLQHFEQSEYACRIAV